MSVEEATALCDVAVHEAKDTRQHAYNKMYVSSSPFPRGTC
jgi:hypothetical protein